MNAHTVDKGEYQGEKTMFNAHFQSYNYCTNVFFSSVVICLGALRKYILLWKYKSFIMLQK